MYEIEFEIDRAVSFRYIWNSVRMVFLNFPNNICICGKHFENLKTALKILQKLIQIHRSEIFYIFSGYNSKKKK